MMARLLFFGTCAGIEPVKGGMHHCSFAVEVNSVYYWFDAGENCSRTAAVMGVDLLRIKSIFISHAHLDHIGGLANLLWSVRKLNIVGKGLPVGGDLRVFIPDMDSWKGVLGVLGVKRGEQISDKFDLVVKRPFDGCIYEDENIKVRAVHNLHVPMTENGEYTSYSYVIETDGKKIVFSGDVKSLSELDSCLETGCDVLICETGHHKVTDVCEKAKEKSVKKLLFFHNGREIINRRPEVDQILAQYEEMALICHDGMAFDCGGIL